MDYTYIKCCMCYFFILCIITEKYTSCSKCVLFDIKTKCLNRIRKSKQMSQHITYYTHKYRFSCISIDMSRSVWYNSIFFKSKRLCLKSKNVSEMTNSEIQISKYRNLSIRYKVLFNNGIMLKYVGNSFDILSNPV